MKTEFKVKELTHEELVDFISTATYGDNSFEILVPEEYAHLKKQGPCDCWEDKIANVLENGGKIDVVDCEDDGYEEGEQQLFQNNAYPLKHHLEKYESYDGDVLYRPTYRIGLDDILNAFSTEEGYGYAKELLVDEEGDFYTAWNLLQLVIFGEVVYG